MTIIHVQQVGDKTLLPNVEFEQLLALARLNGPVAIQANADDIPTIGMMRLAEQGGAFDFWLEPGEDIYTREDGEPL